MKISIISFSIFVLNHKQTVTQCHQRAKISLQYFASNEIVHNHVSFFFFLHRILFPFVGLLCYPRCPDAKENEIWQSRKIKLEHMASIVEERSFIKLYTTTAKVKARKSNNRDWQLNIVNNLNENGLTLAIVCIRREKINGKSGSMASTKHITILILKFTTIRIEK